MDFIKKKPTPFYLAYGEGEMGFPVWHMTSSKERELSDYGYLQASCAAKVKECQASVAEILDCFDYEGSMIYDEYPDKFSMMQLAKSITKTVKEMLPDGQKLPEDEELMQVLVCDEIYKRRLEARNVGHYGIQTGHRTIFNRTTDTDYYE